MVSPINAAYILCVAIVVLHARQRFNTPPTNRSSTRQQLYRRAVLGYVFSTLVLFVVLSYALELEALERLLLGGVQLPGGPGAVADAQEIGALPAPFIAALILTSLLPNVSWLREIDKGILDFFKTMANIPSEVQRRASSLKPHAFSVHPDELEELAAFVNDSASLPNSLQRHLRADPGTGMQLSQFRFTRCVKLYSKLTELAAEPACQRFFSDYAEEFRKAQADFQKFCLRAADGLDIALKHRVENPPEVYEDLMREARENFHRHTNEVFGQLTLLVAGAIVSSRPTDRDIALALREAGFEVEEEHCTDFPLHSLTGLALCLLFYLLAADPLMTWLLRPPSGEQHSVPPSARPFFVVTCHMLTIGVTVWLLQRYPGFQRKPGQPHLWGAYLVCAAAGAAITAALLALVFFARHGTLPPTAAAWSRMVPICVLVGTLCGAVAFFCNASTSEQPPPRSRRLWEAFGCAAAMAAMAVLLLSQIRRPEPASGVDPALAMTALVLFPASVGLIVGFFVPHIYRAARQVSLARRTDGAPDAPKDAPLVGAAVALD